MLIMVSYIYQFYCIYVISVGDTASFIKSNEVSPGPDNTTDDAPVMSDTTNQIAGFSTAGGIYSWIISTSNKSIFILGMSDIEVNVFVEILQKNLG